MNVYILQEALDQLRYVGREAALSGRETVRHLLARHVRGKWVISAVIKAGNPTEEAAHTQADFGAVGRAIAPLVASGYRLSGEAHTHTESLPVPSAGDFLTLRNIKDRFPGYLCVIVTACDEPRITCHSVDEHGRPVEHEIVPYAYDPIIPHSRQDARVLQFGVGSGGGDVALRTALAGAHLTLVDHDTFERSNFRRHLLTPRENGQPKASAVARYLRARGLRAKSVKLRIEPETKRRFARLMSEADIVLDCTGDFRAGLLLAEQAVLANKPIVHAGVWEKGSGGYVLLTKPGQGCLRDLHDLPAPVTDDAETLQVMSTTYGLSDDEISAQVGIFTDITLVAAVQAKVALELLKNDAAHLPNLFLIDNDNLTITPHIVPPRHDCHCNGGKQ